MEVPPPIVATDPWSCDSLTYASGVNEANVVAILKTGKNGTGYATLAEAVEAANDADNDGEKQIVILVKSTAIGSTITIESNLLLVADPGQGMPVVTRSATLSGSLFTVESDSLFTLCGNGSGEIMLQNSYGSAVEVNGTFIMDGGEIRESTGTRAGPLTSGGGVYVAQYASFTMNGGLITANTVNTSIISGEGGGVYVEKNATFTMCRSSISNSGTVGTSNGGRVYVEDGSTFVMNEGEIRGNTTGQISTEANGGGVYVFEAIFTMNNGTIKENTAYENGGGVFVNGIFSMVDGTITKNSAAYGGGVNIGRHAAFTTCIEGGMISENVAWSHGGGINVNGPLTMTGGTITKNTVTGGDKWGGGVAVAAVTGRLSTFIFKSGEIKDNYGAGKSVYGVEGGDNNGIVIAKYLSVDGLDILPDISPLEHNDNILSILTR
jgi:hypothetical protein